MCVGETGIGKTTLIESLFNMKLEFDPCGHELNSVELRSKSYGECRLDFGLCAICDQLTFGLFGL